jgi:hypothetical protein
MPLACKLVTRDHQLYKMQLGETLSSGKPEVGQSCCGVTPPAPQAAGSKVHHASCLQVFSCPGKEGPNNAWKRPNETLCFIVCLQTSAF